jgi:hypothetical protein
MGSVSDKMVPLYCFAISAKRNALFNLTKDNRPVLRKASAHGLGHLLDPYPESEAPQDIPPPAVPLKEIGVRRWQYDFWYKIIEAALRGPPDSVPLDWHPALGHPAAIRYTASSPALLKWMSRWNKGRAYAEQIRPFGFMLSGRLAHASAGSARGYRVQAAPCCARGTAACTRLRHAA